jgi:hypothetical protein
MFLGSPVDADGCLVGKWRTNIHKHVIAVGMETAESAWHWLSKAAQAVRSVKQHNLEDSFNQTRGQPARAAGGKTFYK